MNVQNILEFDNGNFVEFNGFILEEEFLIIDIIINNVVCSFNIRCYFNFRSIVMEGLYVEYRRE